MSKYFRDLEGFEVAPDTGFELLSICILKFYNVLQNLLNIPIFRRLKAF